MPRGRPLRAPRDGDIAVEQARAEDRMLYARLPAHVGLHVLEEIEDAHEAVLTAGLAAEARQQVLREHAVSLHRLGPRLLMRLRRAHEHPPRAGRQDLPLILLAEARRQAGLRLPASLGLAQPAGV